MRIKTRIEIENIKGIVWLYEGAGFNRVRFNKNLGKEIDIIGKDCIHNTYAVKTEDGEELRGIPEIYITRSRRNLI